MIEFDQVSIGLGDFLLDKVSLSIGKGDYYCIMGPSGAGKTIILEAIAGLLVPDSGRILHNGEDVRGIPPEKRRIGLVYQDYSLFPHMTVEKNIAFGMRMRHLPEPEITERVRQLMHQFGISHIAARAPFTLSGGEQQRVAIARALAIEPELLLLDEPLSALDPVTREQFIGELRSLHRDEGLTIVHVTHDRRDPISLGTRMAMIIDGRLIQEDRVGTIFSSPHGEQVARFIGYENILKGTVTSSTEGLCTVDIGGSREVAVVADAGKGDRIALCIRADTITVSRNDGQKTSARNTFFGTITRKDSLGSLATITVDIGVEITALVTGKSVEEMELDIGTPVCISFKATGVHMIHE
ncbi:MAG TPA: ATP-binding cassette domain-containing protein [Methanoregula sp.]|nr:ATP-binding cassette domain-containing protein [Methanoregula sp.]